MTKLYCEITIFVKHFFSKNRKMSFLSTLGRILAEIRIESQKHAELVLKKEEPCESQKLVFIGVSDRSSCDYAETCEEYD